jgi:hypothetical protein
MSITTLINLGFVALASLGCVSCSVVSSSQAPAAAAAVPPGQTACSYSSAGGSFSSANITGSNVVAVQISAGGVCGNIGSGGTVNQPCASVTVCTPGNTNQCETISNILVDTGSYGLRIFSSALSQNLCSSLTPVTDPSGNPVAECAQFGTGQDWGAVMLADVQLGGETPVQVPIQVINQGFSYAPSVCASGDVGPASAGFNGILGVGLFAQDCGAICSGEAGAGGLYWSCSGTSCSGVKMTLANQVQNPVASLSSDNNGVIMELPSLSGDAASVAGSLILGIDTKGNNSSNGTTKYGADSSANFVTVFQTHTYSQSFIDSGSNLLFIPSSGLTDCGNDVGFLCPASPTAMTAVIKGASGSPSSPTVNFTISNAEAILNYPNAPNNYALEDIGGDATASGFSHSFDWGLPFFYGRSVYVGIEGMSSNLGTGPYWAY